MSAILRSVSELWQSLLESSNRHKEDEFAADAREAMLFLDGPHDFMYEPAYGESSKGLMVGGGEDYPDPQFKMTVNKVAEMVQIFLPVLYHKNPVRTVTPYKCRLPMELEQFLAAYGVYATDPSRDALKDLKALMMEHYLNFTPNELNLRGHSRSAIVEALIKGRGLLYTQVFNGPKGRMVGSFFDSVDNLLIDPDAESLLDAKWVSRQRRMPIWKASQIWGVPESELKASSESAAQTARVDSSPGGATLRAGGGTNDLIVVNEVFSRMGMGGRLSNAHPALRDVLERFGDAVYLVIADNVPFPLNLPPAIAQTPGMDDEIRRRVSWPIAFYRDAQHPWPFSHLDFHEKPRSAWPYSHIKPAMGEQKFLNWAYSFLASKIRITCRDFVCIPEYASNELREAILNGKDLALIDIKQKYPQAMKEIVQFIQHPELKGDMWQVIQAIEQNFERRTGLMELMYGQSSRQFRSAAESNIKRDMLALRPDYMADCVEDWQAVVARKEAIAARNLLGPGDVGPAYGEENGDGPYSQLWAQVMMSQDIDMLVAEFDYRIESGSSRKPNKATQIANIDESAQVVFPALMQVYQQTGDPTPANAWLKEWAKSRDMDPSIIVLPPAPPPPPPGQEGQPPGPPGGPPPMV